MQTQMLMCLALVFFVTTAKGHEIIKRADDTNALETVVSALSQEVSTLKAEVQALKNAANQKVWFLTELSSAHVTHDSPIRFALVGQGGSGYDASTGVYTVPVTGLYLFQFQMFPKFGSTAGIFYDLFVNGNILLRTYDGLRSSTTLHSAINLPVHQGDRVWLQSNTEGDFWPGAGSTAHHSYLSAVLLYAG